MWYIYTVEYYSAINRNEIMPFASTWMQLQTIILSKVSQKERDRYQVLSLNMRNLKYDMKEPNHETETESGT